MKRFSQRFRSFVCVAALAVAAVPSALAHAHPKAMTPAPNSAGPAPKAVTITFSEAVEPKFSSIRLTDGAGKMIGAGASHPVAGDAKTLTLALPRLAPGSYAVHWANVSVDGHRLEGSYTFTVR